MIDLRKGDCNNILLELDDNSIDLLLTDPPYNIARKTNFNTMGNRGGTVAMDFGEWDYNADILSYIDKLPRILKNNANIVIFNAWENLGIINDRCEKNNIFIKRCLVLNKSNPAPFNMSRMFVNNVEFALWGVFLKLGIHLGGHLIIMEWKGAFWTLKYKMHLCTQQ